jgi:hypothetical protein
MTHIDLDALQEAADKFDTFLNEPPSYEQERMVREYRHDAYPKWVKIERGLRDVIDRLRKAEAAQASMKTLLQESCDFWRHYSYVNEMAQEEMRGEPEDILNRMDLAATADALPAAPADPTETMLLAGAQAIRLDGTPEQKMEAARAVYCAMLAVRREDA